jgi:hypothetical protein
MRNPGIGLTAAFLMLCLYVVPQAAEDPSLVLYFDFEDGEGDTVEDRSMYGNHGNIQGNAIWANGKYGAGLEIDKTSFVLVPDCDEFKITDELTLACWAKCSAFAPEAWQGNSLDFLVCRWNWELGQWYNIVSVFDGSKVKIYVDGEEKGSADHAGNIFAGEGPIIIGDNNLGSATDYHFVGVIDEVAVYNRALGQVEIKRAMESGHTFAVEYEAKLATTWGDVKVRY